MSIREKAQCPSCHQQIYTDLAECDKCGYQLPANWATTPPQTSGGFDRRWLLAIPFAMLLIAGAFLIMRQSATQPVVSPTSQAQAVAQPTQQPVPTQAATATIEASQSPTTQATIEPLPPWLQVKVESALHDGPADVYASNDVVIMANTMITALGKNGDGTWYQICYNANCSQQQGWIAAANVKVVSQQAIDGLPIINVDPPTPTVEPTAPPTVTSEPPTVAAATTIPPTPRPAPVNPIKYSGHAENVDPTGESRIHVTVYNADLGLEACLNNETCLGIDGAGKATFYGVPSGNYEVFLRRSSDHVRVSTKVVANTFGGSWNVDFGLPK